jgi:hypothetical protein
MTDSTKTEQNPLTCKHENCQFIGAIENIQQHDLTSKLFFLFFDNAGASGKRPRRRRKTLRVYL